MKVIELYLKYEKSVSSVSQGMIKLHRQFFYIPDTAVLGESIARFDRVRVIVGKDRSAIEPIGLRLSDDVFNLF